MKNALIIESDVGAIKRLCTILQLAYSDIELTRVHSISEAIKLCRLKTFSLLIFEFDLADGNYIDVISNLRSFASASYFVILTKSDDDKFIFEAFRQGVDGYILKDQNDFEIVKLLKAMNYGVPPLSPTISRKILKHLSYVSSRKIKNTLSQQEINVLTLVAKGYTRKEISRLMEISINTVSAYTKSTYKKLDINNCSEATLEAVRLGLVAVMHVD